MKPQNATDAYTLMGALAKHDNGTIHIGEDGVCRSFHSNGTVLDYVKFTPQHIQHIIKGYRGSTNLTEVLTGVNGHDVTDAQALNPSNALVPDRFKADTELGRRDTTGGKSKPNPLYIRLLPTYLPNHLELGKNFRESFFFGGLGGGGGNRWVGARHRGFFSGWCQ